MAEDGPKAAGCVVTLDDLPRVCVSLSCYCAQLGNGSTTALLGLAIPRFADRLGLPCSDFGILFIFSGVGYFAGVNLASVLLHRFQESSKFLWTLAFSCITAAGVLAMYYAPSMWALRLLVFLQYIGVAGVDAFCTVALGEMWGQRVQPWMQSRSAFYAVGGMIPPLVLQRSDSLLEAVHMCVLLCLSTVLGGSVEMLHSCIAKWSAKPDFKFDVVNEQTPLTATHLSSIKASSRASARGVLESKELVALEDLLSPSGGDASKDSVQSVFSSMDDQPNCARGVEHVTLAFATAPIVDSLHSTPLDSYDVEIEPSTSEKMHSIVVADLVSSITLIPSTGRALLTAFLFLFCTFSASFIGWFPTFCSVKASDGENIPPGMEEKVVSVYFLFMSCGCIASIPCSIWIPNRTLMRFHLVLIIAGVALLELALANGLVVYMLLAASALMGYGVSAVFPLTMTMANDYGFTADASATTTMLMGGSLGSSLVPTVIGYLMRLLGPSVLPLCVLVLGGAMVAAYIGAHQSLTKAAAERRRKHM